MRTLIHPKFFRLTNDKLILYANPSVFELFAGTMLSLVFCSGYGGALWAAKAANQTKDGGLIFPTIIFGFPAAYFTKRFVEDEDNHVIFNFKATVLTPWLIISMCFLL